MKRLVLVGGGHAHVEVLRRFARQPERAVELVLVSPADDTPYSGMLPGLVAGHYRYGVCHLDLRVICVAARARFVRTRATAIDPDRRTLVFASGATMHYDVASLDVGSTPPLSAIRGADTVGTPVKPVDAFLAEWSRILDRAGHRAPRIAVVGTGAGGIEIALALDHRLRSASGPSACRLCIVGESPALLPGHAERVRARLASILDRRGIEVRTGVGVAEATGAGLLLDDGSSVDADWIVWATGAAAPAWLASSGLDLDERGFVQVERTLCSTSHPAVFAAGDVASVRGTPRPKSGVYAVRQGPPLAANLRAALRGEALRPFVPQARALSLIGTGGRHAVASWGELAVEGDWVWRWKDLIDRRFMSRYR